MAQRLRPSGSRAPLQPDAFARQRGRARHRHGAEAARRARIRTRRRGQPMAPGEEAVSPDGAQPEDPDRVLIHDFRNLLAVIVNYSELISEELDDPEAIRADIKEVKTA